MSTANYYGLKIGDWVTITKSDMAWNNDMDKYDLRTVQITSIDPETQYIRFKNDGGWAWGWNWGHFKLCAYPVGSYVKLLKSECGYVEGDIGQVVEKENSTSGMIFVPYRTSTSSQYPNVWFSFNDVEPATEEEFLQSCEKNLPMPTKRFSFYITYDADFTEDFFYWLMLWAKKNCTGEPRGIDDTYQGLKQYKYFIFDNAGFNTHSSITEKGDSLNISMYGVDNNIQGCFLKYSVADVKSMIGYVEPVTSKASYAPSKPDIFWLPALQDPSLRIGQGIFDQIQSIPPQYRYGMSSFGKSLTDQIKDIEPSYAKNMVKTKNRKKLSVPKELKKLTTFIK